MSFPTFLLQAKLDAGVYTLHDLRVLCRKEDKHWCPYYLARHMLAFANVIVYNYQYMLDPKARRLSLREFKVCENKFCPYYLSRHVLAFASVIVYNYQYMLDPKAWRVLTILWRSLVCSVCRAPRARLPQRHCLQLPVHARPEGAACLDLP